MRITVGALGRPCPGCRHNSVVLTSHKSEVRLIASQRDGPDRALGGVVVDGNQMVVGEHAQCRPPPQGVVDRPRRGVGLGQLGPLLAQPGMQRVQPRLGVLAASPQSRDGVEVTDVLLDAVQLANALQRLGGQGAAGELVRLEELAPRVRPASRFTDGAAGEQRLVAAEVIDHQRARPATQELARMLPGPTAAVVVDHQRLARAAIHPHVGAVGLARARLKLGHRGLMRRFAVELLADLLADALEHVALRAQPGVDLVVVFDALQVAGQRLAFRAAFVRAAPLVIGGAVLGLLLLLQQRLRLGIEQLALLAVQALAGLAEAPALQPRHLQAQRRILERLALGLARQLLDETACVKRRRVVAQRAQLVVIDRLHHARHSRVRARARQSALAPMDSLQITRIASACAAAVMRCQGRPATSQSHCWALSRTVAASSCGQAKPPSCSRRAHSQIPAPSNTSTFSRVARRLANTYAWCGCATPNLPITWPSRRSMPPRRSLLPTASQTASMRIIASTQPRPQPLRALDGCRHRPVDLHPPRPDLANDARAACAHGRLAGLHLHERRRPARGRIRLPRQPRPPPRRMRRPAPQVQVADAARLRERLAAQPAGFIRIDHRQPFPDLLLAQLVLAQPTTHGNLLRLRKPQPRSRGLPAQDGIAGRLRRTCYCSSPLAPSQA